MFKWIRSPLTWMVIVELVVVSLLVVTAWNVIATTAKPAPALPGSQWPGSATEPSRPGWPEPIGGRSEHRGPLPGLNLDSAFWQQRLRELNRDQAYFEQLEWRIVHAAMDTTRRYLEAVVLPSIRHAEHAGSPLLG